MNQPLDPTVTGPDSAWPSTHADEAGDPGGRPDPRDRLASGESMDTEELVEWLCTEQVERWRAGERIPAEAYLALHPTLGGGSEAAFELIYGEYLIRESMGEAPRVEEFCWRFPDLAERFRRQVGLHGALMETDPGTELDHSGAAETPVGSRKMAVPVVRGFEVMGILGQGAMSVVYLARHATLNRLVALKMIRAGVYADPNVAARFRDEAEAAARFQHSNIIQVYEVGESEGHGYLVLEYAEGGNLQQKLAATPQPPQEAARLVEPMARALHYAHRRGIVHRDLKPANIVLDGEGVPKVTDFGLAKLMEREGGLTRTGDIMGTPSYMAPEQARGLPSEVTASADIYALGAILYEMLTGRPPFKGSTPLSTLSQVTEQEVLSPCRLQRNVPRDLETICLKCLQKEPRKRYATAEDLADDLRRFLEDRPILARRIGRSERALRWCRREPVKAALGGALTLAIVAGFWGVMVQARRAEVRAQAEARERGRAEAAESRALDSLYFSRISQARLEWRLNNVPVTRQLLDECDPARRGWEWRHLEAIGRPELIDVPVPEGISYIDAVAFRPDGRRFAMSAEDRYANEDRRKYRVEVWESQPPRRVLERKSAGVVAHLEFSRDGRRLLGSGPSGSWLWDAGTGDEIRSWPVAGGLSYSPDCRELVSCRDGRIQFWDAGTGRAVRDFASESGRATYGPDGRIVAVSGAAAVELYEAATGKWIRRLPHGPGDPKQRQSRLYAEVGPDLAFSPDGRSLAVTTDPPRVWDLESDAPRHRLVGHDGAVAGIAFSPDGRQVATGGVDGTIRLWDARTGVEESVLRGHSAWVGCLTFHPEGWCLLSGGRHKAEARIWDLTRHPEFVSLPGRMPLAVQFEPDGRRLALVGSDGRLHHRDADGGTIEVGPRLDIDLEWMTPARVAEFSGDGRRLATVAGDRRLVKVWNARDGRPIATLDRLAVPASYVAISHDGDRVAAAAIDASKFPRKREVCVWDVATGRVLARFRPEPSPQRPLHGRVALDPAGQRIAFDDYEDAAFDPVAMVPLGHARPIVRVCEVPGGRELLRLGIPGVPPIYAIAFSPDGSRLVAVDFDGLVRVWDLSSGAVLHETHWDDTNFRFAFSPDGRRLAGVDRTRVQIRDAADGREILVLRGARSRATDGGFNPLLAWSPDGARLSSTNWDGSLGIWDAPTEAILPDRRREEAGHRVFGWHLDQAEAAIAEGDRRAAELHLGWIRSDEPPDAIALQRRAELAWRLGRLDEADRDFARWLDGGKPGERAAGLLYARLFLMRNDLAGYQTLLGRLLDSAEKSEDPESAGELARVIGLSACSAEVGARVARLVTRIRATDLKADPSLYLDVAMARYRAGEWGSAREALASFEKAYHGDRSLVDPMLAMVEHRLGHRGEATKHLARARERRDEHRRRSGSGEIFIDPGWFEYERLLSEAESTVEGRGVIPSSGADR